MSFLDDPLVTSVLFYPRKIVEPTNLQPPVQTINLQISASTTIGGVFVTKDPSYPTLMIFHGNGEIATDYLSFMQLYDDLQVNIAVVDFRGYGFSSGSPSFSALLEDSLPTFAEMEKWLQTHDYNTHVVILGRSLGSVCAAQIGSYNPSNLMGIIFESGFASLYNRARAWLGGGLPVAEEAFAPFSNHTKIKLIYVPILVIHGTDDQIIPYSEGQAIYDNATNAKHRTMTTIQGAGHNDIFSYTKQYKGTLIEFVSKLQ